MKILAIGNSFSEDATAYLYRIASSAKTELSVVNLCIGGCSLEMHANNLRTDAKAYKKFVNTDYIEETVSIKDTLLSDTWDAVTIQQVSYLSGLIDTYEPYAQELINTIKQYSPSAKIYFHKTWAYEIDSTHNGFSNYGCSQKRMLDMINKTSDIFCKDNNLQIIPTGDVIAALRNTSAFDYANGGESLCRDGFHMQKIYGRYAVGAAYFQTITGISIKKSDFAPNESDKEKIAIIKDTVDIICGGVM